MMALFSIRVLVSIIFKSIEYIMADTPEQNTMTVRRCGTLNGHDHKCIKYNKLAKTA